MSISLKNLLLVLSSIDPAGYFNFGGAVLKSEVVLGLTSVAHGRTIGGGGICGEVGGETPGGSRIVLEIEGETVVRKVRVRCAVAHEKSSAYEFSVRDRPEKKEE